MSGRISEEDIKIVGEIFKDTGLACFLDDLREWIKQCSKLRDDEEAKAIADANLNPEKIEEHKRKFWEGYSRSIPMLSFCLSNGSYQIDNNALSEHRYLVPKIALFNWKYPLSGAEGDRYGRFWGKEMEKGLLDKMAKRDSSELKVEGGFSELISEAFKWLKREGCDSDEGIFISIGKRSPSAELFSDEDYVPSWKEEVRSLGFDGFYKGFPVVWLREEKNKNEVDSTEKAKEIKYNRIVAVNMRGWTGISVRKDVVSKKHFGKLEIREWEKQEIDEAIKSGKLNEKDINEAKRNCPVDVSFFWKFSSDELPRRKIFSVANDDDQQQIV